MKKRYGLWMGAVWSGAALLAQAQVSDNEAEHKVVQQVQVVPAATGTVGGKIRPLTWRCEMGDKACSLSLADIEFVALQDYVVDGRIYVTEATAAMRSKSFIRIYFIEDANPGGVAGETATQASQRVQTAVQNYIGVPGVLPGAPFSRRDVVVKNYPITTHAQQIEYRVTDKKSVTDIYNSMEKAWLEFKSFPIIESQQSQTVRSIAVGK